MTKKVPVLHDEICLYDIDYQCLQDGKWLRDTILYYKIICLERKYKDLIKEHYCKIFYPPVAQLLQNYPYETAVQCLPHLDITQFKLIFFPFSDFNPETQSATHWSLLFIDNRNGDMILQHFDSHNQANWTEAQKLSELLGRAFNFEAKNLKMFDSPTQTNGYDCGIYVLAFIDALIEHRGDSEAAKRVLTPEYTHEYRKQLREYIPARAKEIEEQRH